MASTTTRTTQRRAIGIVRVSEVKGRDGESFQSPTVQRERIEAECERRDDWRLLHVAAPELNVPGKTPLDERPGLGPAVRAIEAGDADLIVFPYFDRSFRDIDVMREAIRRVEAAGGDMEAIGFGKLTNGTANEKLNTNLNGSIAQYWADQTAEKVKPAVQAAIDRGVPPWPNVTPGYVRADDGRFDPDPKARKIVVRAFRLRADGTSVQDVQTFLRAKGIELGFHGVTTLLRSRVVLGEIHFGKYEPNLKAHEPIVDRDLWQRVQDVRMPRGRRAKSERLLARLGVLRCASCDSRMVVGSSHHGEYWLYRCPPTGDCSARSTISAELVEGIVVDAVKQALADVTGKASPDDRIRQAEAELDHAQAAYDALMGILDPLEPAAVKRLGDAKELRDAAREHLEQLGGTRAAPLVTLNAAADWDDLTLDGRRALIRATVDRVSVAPGRGADRVTVELFES